MAAVRIAYVGGGSTRAPGTVATFVDRADDFHGSEIVLIDLDPERLEVVARIGRRLAESRGADITFTTTTDRRAGLRDCCAVLTSFRPGGFEARAFDERIPLRHGVIGQETQGPGGFFMALRSIPIMAEIAAELERVAPGAWIVNYTNPVNIVAQALTQNTSVPVVSLCEGAIVYPRFLAQAAGLDPDLLETVSVGLNHATWSISHSYRGADVIPLLCEAHESRGADPSLPPERRRQLRLAATMGSIPSEYFQYYYFRDEILSELQAKRTTRAEDILAETPDYWEHYEDEAEAEHPTLDPARSRIGIHELELAIDVMGAMLNSREETLYVNVPNRGALAAFPDDLVVELPGRVSADGIDPISQPSPPRHVLGLLEMLAEYQLLTASAAWSGTRREAIWALTSNPLVLSLPKAEAIYDELASAHAHLLPERLLR